MAVDPTDFSVLDQTPGIGTMLAYGRYAGVPWYRSFWAVSLGFVLLLVPSGAAAVSIVAIGNAKWPWFLPAIPAGWALFAGIGLCGWIVGYLRRVRLAQFAARNHLAFADLLEQNRRPGLGFPRHLRNIERAVVGGIHGGVRFELGTNHSAVRGNQDRVDIRKPFAFIEFELPSEVPHIFLKNRRSRILPVSGLALSASTALKLEGNFNETFTLLCPAGYERDALYIFTPNLMAALLDTAQDAEVELVDSRAYIYLNPRTRIWRAEKMRSIYATIDALAGRLNRQTMRYSDERVEHASAGVALGGRRILGGQNATGLTILWVTIATLMSVAVIAVTVFVIPALGS